ncbi:hypothetical protein LR48_Vigan11g038100 [Vigna angularis]|uniref:Uncharacterized protein n=1 Tax=Phaseolus angularis TaxID=3914 RepID=A0A0L9VQW0_PHAAN|nr:hypothetical protein LR48_Vigan11g038100 [Vigna angularis]
MGEVLGFPGLKEAFGEKFPKVQAQEGLYASVKTRSKYLLTPGLRGTDAVKACSMRVQGVAGVTEALCLDSACHRDRKAVMCDILWQDIENFVDDGIQIEPFNLDKEREEGYFHAAANFVEYGSLQDAWLDNIEFDPKYSALKSVPTNDVDEGMPDLSSKDIAVMKRRIANVLEPGETVLQALRRLKGNSDRKAKMSAETKVVFDQLTEDAMKLMENGEYNVYHEKREVFDREAG